MGIEIGNITEVEEEMFDKTKGVMGKKTFKMACGPDGREGKRLCQGKVFLQEQSHAIALSLSFFLFWEVTYG